MSKYFNNTILTFKNVFVFFTERNGIWLPYVFELWENFDHGNFILFNQTFPCFHTVLRNLYLGSTKDGTKLHFVIWIYNIDNIVLNTPGKVVNVGPK